MSDFGGFLMDRLVCFLSKKLLFIIIIGTPSRLQGYHQTVSQCNYSNKYSFSIKNTFFLTFKNLPSVYNEFFHLI